MKSLRVQNGLALETCHEEGHGASCSASYFAFYGGRARYILEILTKLVYFGLHLSY